MPPNPARRSTALVLTFLATLLAFGCGATSIPVQPAPAGPPDAADSGLGPGVRPLSFGPGDKGSPRVSPSGNRLAFVLDGYVAEKAFYAQGFSRRTGDGFEAAGAEWLSEDDLAVLGRKAAGENTSGGDAPGSLFLTRPGDTAEDPLRLLQATESVGALDALSGGGFVAAMEAPGDAGNSKLVLFRGRVKVYPEAIPGRVVGLSISPDGDEAALAVRREADGAGHIELLSYRFQQGSARRLAVLTEEQEILGDPQWTDEGIHFIAGEEGAPYALYRVSGATEGPEPVRGVGEGFLPAGVEASPDGEKLAVVGRRNASSPTDLYVLDIASGTLEAITANENMEVKTGPRDLVWSPDGSGVVFVARVILSGPEVYSAPASSLAPAFYNFYLAPVPGAGERPR